MHIYHFGGAMYHTHPVISSLTRLQKIPIYIIFHKKANFRVMKGMLLFLIPQVF